MTRKRGQGEGTIRKRADGRWEAMATIHLPDGTTKRQSLYGKTQKEVREKLTAIRRDQDRGLPVVTERQTVGEFLARWLEEAARPKLKPKTYASYAQLIRLYIVPALGKQQLATLAPQHIQAMMNRMVKGGLSHRTARYTHAVLRRALNQAERWGLVARNVAKLVDPPRAQPHDILFLTPEQARTLLDTVRDDRLAALYSVALSLGLRQGEILGLRWEDVDLERRTVTVRKQLQRIDRVPQLVDLKTRQSRRTINLPAPLVQQLRAHRAQQAQERLQLGQDWHDWGLVFCSTIGTPLEPRNLVRLFKAHLQRAGLPDVRFHDLRHSCASFLIAQGVNPRIVMETLGHSQIGLTMNTYAHVFLDAQRQAAEAMERLFPGTEASAD